MKRDMFNQFLLFFLVILLYPCLFDSHSLHLNSTTITFSSCLRHQSSILLQLKSEFTFQRLEYDDILNTSYPKMKSWKAGGDCCSSWDGVSCDMATGYVISLDLSQSWLHGSLRSYSSLFRLLHLRKLDLSFNNFTSCPIPSEFGEFSRLTHLNLSHSMFYGHILVSGISRLTNLISLDLSNSCDFYELNNISIDPDLTGALYMKEGEVGMLTQNMTNLRQLYLDRVQIHSPVPIHFANLSSLTHLSLQDCNLHGNGFSGQIPYSLGNLTQLELLHLASNSFSGKLPISLPYRVKEIDASENDLTGSIPSIVSNLTFLEELALQDNLFTGVIPSSLFRLPSLTFLYLENNQFTGYLNVQNVSSSPLLHSLILSGNNLTGLLSSKSQLTKLAELKLDSNDLSGRLDFGIFSEMSSLSSLDLSNNRGLFITNLSTTSTLSNKFWRIYLSSCNITEFPIFLKTQGELEELDLSNNNISDPIPKWLLSVGTESLMHLNLSHNFIRGWEKAPLILPWKAMGTLDLRSNKLHGSLVVPPMSTRYFSISENSLVGRIDPLFCKLGTIEYLDLSSNKLSGAIPQCLGNSSFLSVLNLRRNNLNGNMPQKWGDRNQLQTLDLSYNNLNGNIPKSLTKCKELQILNLGHNHMTDTFPFMLHSLPKFQILILSSNKFYGPIWHPHSFFGFASLSIIDISFNDFTGSLPSEYFRNWTSMKASYNKSQSKFIGVDSFSEPYSVTMINKGLVLSYARILIYFVSIDFSNNKFYGEIPSSIGDARDLVVLNLSRNNFTGRIPSSLGNLIELESLDLSNNELSGEIPQQLTSLMFLGYLNLSNNQLTGPIPQATQIGTFSDSFEGNWGLCGPPLSKKCETSPLPPSHYSEDSGDSVFSGFGWKAVAIGYGCGLIIGLMLGHIITSRSPYLVFKIFRVIPPRRLRGANS